MHNRTYPHIVRFITQHPWAILPEKLDAIAEFLSHRLVNLEPPQRQQVLAALPVSAAAAPSFTRAGAVAVLPVMGVIAKRLDMFSEISGGFSIERWQQSFRQAVADPDVGSILLHVHSPGGSVYGVQEAADEILAARGQKKIVAIADDLAASAAYWIASAADEIVVTPSGEVGSIGVVAMHVDYSKRLENEGIAVTFIHAGENKVEGNPYQPMAEDALAFAQSRVDDYYRAFTKAVARGRGISVAEVNKNFGQGRVFGSEHAKSVGMVDRIATMAETIERLQPRRARSNRAAMAAEADIAAAILKAS
jgi:signal peptide peptidase SppA